MSGVGLALSGMRFVALVTAGVVLLTVAGLAIRRLSSDDPSPLGTPLTVATQVAPPATATTVVTLEPTPELHGVMVPQLCRDD